MKGLKTGFSSKTRFLREYAYANSGKTAAAAFLAQFYNGIENIMNQNFSFTN
jgi:hypothetical protein